MIESRPLTVATIDASRATRRRVTSPRARRPSMRVVIVTTVNYTDRLDVKVATGVLFELHDRSNVYWSLP